MTRKHFSKAIAVAGMLTENEKARLWRQAMGLSRKTLSQATGFSVSSIADIEAGRYRENGHPISAAVFQKYRLACGAVTADVKFNWYRATARSHDLTKEGN